MKIAEKALQLYREKTDFLRFDGIAEITPIDSGDAGTEVRNREGIEELLGESTE